VIYTLSPRLVGVFGASSGLSAALLIGLGIVACGGSTGVPPVVAAPRTTGCTATEDCRLSCQQNDVASCARLTDLYVQAKDYANALSPSDNKLQRRLCS
jgi:hypothetical protein